jgi:hypothetical protein
MSRRDRDLKRLAAKHGRSVECTKGGHLRLVRAGAAPIIVSSSSSCWRAGRNLEAMLRRHDRQAA